MIKICWSVFFFLNVLKKTVFDNIKNKKMLVENKGFRTIEYVGKMVDILYNLIRSFEFEF